MEKTKKMRMPVLLGALLAAILVGVAGAKPNDRPLASPGTKLTIHAAYFHPVQDGCDYSNDGGMLTVWSGACIFVAPVIFPGPVMVNGITLYAFDSDGGEDISVFLLRAAPHNAKGRLMGYTRTLGASDTDPRVFTDYGIDFNPVRRKHGPFLSLEMVGSPSLRFYAVKIDYTKL